MNTLLHVILVHHPDHDFAIESEKVIRRVFGTGTEDSTPEARIVGTSVWNGVCISSVTDQAGLEALQVAENDRALWILLVDYPMTVGAEWPKVLEFIGDRLDAATQVPEQNRIGVLILGEKSALDRVPDSLKNLQGKPQAQLGEHRMGPYRLGLLALHRARLILGRTPGMNRLKLFISHAKADGVFFADALNSAVKQVPELEAWYDAQDIPSGTRNQRGGQRASE